MTTRNKDRKKRTPSHPIPEPPSGGPVAANPKKRFPFNALTGAWLGWLAVFALPITAPAQNLLEGKPVSVAPDKGSGAEAWLPSITFDKAGRHDLRLRVEFDLKSPPATPVLTLKKPADMAEWTLNGKPLLGPPKDERTTELAGIPVSALKTGTNVLEAKFAVKVTEHDGKLSPSTTGGIRLDLRPGDVKQFGFKTGPVLGAAGPNYFTVGCLTRMPATVTLQCDGRTWTSKPGVVHLLRADGLKAGREYQYKLVADLAGGGATAATQAWKIKTLPEQGPLTFIALGDARSNPKIWGFITGEVLKFDPAFVIHTGDIVGRGDEYELWENEFAKPAEKYLATIPCFYTFGNHEKNVSMIYQLFGFPEQDRSSYTQAVGPVQLFAMNRFENWGKGSPNLERMEKELAASKSPFIFAFTHSPAWSSGIHGNDKLGQEVHFPIFDKYGVTALVAGHDHCYERSEPGGTTMLITGGGGAPLYKPEHQKDNPHSKIYRPEYNFLVFRVDDRKCEMKACCFGGLKTPYKERMIDSIDSRTWEARKQAGGKLNQ